MLCLVTLSLDLEYLQHTERVTKTPATQLPWCCRNLHASIRRAGGQAFTVVVQLSVVLRYDG